MLNVDRLQKLVLGQLLWLPARYSRPHEGGFSLAE